MKVCIKCHIRKPQTEFYKHPTNKDRLQAYCKKCMRQAVLSFNYGPRKSTDADKRSRKKWKAMNKEKAKLYNKVHSMVSQAIERGMLSKGVCEVCGNYNSQAHHDDYEKPLEVRWLCRTHHMQHHLKERGGKRSLSKD